MNFSPEEASVSPPCFFVNNSQVEDSQLYVRSRSDQHLTILKHLSISTCGSSNAVTSAEGKNCPLVSDDIKLLSCPGRGGEEGGEEEADRQSFGQGGTGDQQGRDGGGEGAGDGGGGGNDGDRGGGHSGGGHGNGGGGDGGDDGDNDGNDGAGGEQDEDAEEGNEHSEPASTSSDSIPKLVRPEAIITGDRWREGSLPASQVRRDIHRRPLSDSSLSSTGGGDGRVVTPLGNSGDNYSEASTCIVGQGADVASDFSEVPTISDDKKSTSGLDSKSKKGSIGSSSSYHGDLSSLSSGGSLPTPPEVRKHLPLHAMARAQSSSDVSSGSAGSKEGKRASQVVGFKWWSVEREHVKGADDSDVVCSSQEDMFASSQGRRGVQKEHQPQSLSAEETHFSSPQHRSTPVEDEKKAESKQQDHSGKLLYKQVLAKQQTSTPVGGTSGEFLPTPYSQGTPVERFNSLQFSGDTTGYVKETSSSSSSDKIPPSPEACMSVPMLIPLSPTANEEESDERKRKSSSDEEKSPEVRLEAMKEGRSQQLTKGDTVEEEKSEMSRAAEALLLEERTDHSAGPTVHPQKRKVEDVSTDEEAILLPRWQQELPKEEGVTADGKRTLSSISSSSEFLQQESTAHQMQQWQSVTSAFESSSSISENKRVQQTELPATTAGGCGEQFNTALDISSHEDNTAVYRKEIYPLHGAASKPAQEEPSLSPSSLAADPFNVVEVSKTDTQESLAAVAGPTQPDLSEDLFRPSVTLHGSQGASHKEDISDKSEVEDSQDDGYQFSLHLTQSQVDTELQRASVTTSQTTKDAFKLPSFEGGEKCSESRDASQREQMAPLTNQDSSCVVPSESQSVLAPLVLESAQTFLVQAIKDKVLEHFGTADGAQVAVASKDVVSCNLHSSQKDKAEKVGRKITHKSTNCPPVGDVQVGFTHPEHPLEKCKPCVDNEDAGGDAPLSKQNEPPVEQTTNENVTPVRQPIKPRLPATIFSQSSVESGTEAEFHFSIPKDPEPLRPVSSVTPPPMRPVRCDTPYSEERGAGPALIRDALPVVTETPGMSSQAPRPPSLTVSMPRRESLEGGSDNSEPAFHFESAIRPVAMAPVSSASPQTPPRESPLFIRARQLVANTKKRELESDSNSDPFAFTARDDVPEPPKKRLKRTPTGSGRREVGNVRDDLLVLRDEHQGESTRRLLEGPVSSTNKSFGERSGESEETKEMEEVANRSPPLDKPGLKRGQSDRIESSESGELGERLKRVRTEKPLELDTTAGGSSEPAYYQQITHTRLVTTVTTVVQRIVTVSIVNKVSGEVVEAISYEDNEQPKVERNEKDSKEVHEFVQYSSADGSRVELTSESLRKQEQAQQQPRTSPRTRSTAVSRVSEPRETSEATSRVRKEPHQKAQERETVKTDAETVPPTITRQDTVPVLNDACLQRPSSSDSPVAPGTRVLAKWLDGYFYPGKVTAGPNKNGRYAVTFDDGDKRRIPRENVIIKDILPAGQSVMAQGEGEFDFYEQGTIVGHYRNGDERGYEVQIQSGAISRFPVCKIILSERQAASVLSSGESSLTATSGSSISIGIHSLRSKTDGSSTGSTVSPRNLTKTSGSAVGTATRDTSCKDTSESSSEERRRARKSSRPSPSIAAAVAEPVSPSRDVTPKSTRKSSRKVKERTRRNGQRIAESGSEASCDERAKGAGNGRHRVRRGLSCTFGGKSPAGKPLASSGPSEPPTRRSPRKYLNTKDNEGGTRSSSEEDPEPGPLPQNRNVFAGLAFLVTGVVKYTSRHEESDSECERVAFNRGHLKRQIEAGGGVVLSSFPRSQISSEDCFLISNTHQRTQKYFQSLAAGIPCVSHAWIIDSCASNKRLGYQKYLLPAGYSLEEGEVVECRPRRNIFGNMRVYLHGSQHFKDTWSSVLLAAGCKMVTKLPNRLSRTLETEGLDYQCDVVICGDNKLPATVKYATNVLHLPIVSLEWLLQSLISGRQLAFDSHPKYDYKHA